MDEKRSQNAPDSRPSGFPPAPPRPFILGLAGGIASGKSLVASEFARLGCQVIDFDDEVRRVLARPEIARELANWWGPEILGEDGLVDRHEVGTIVFADANQRRRLEELLHPLVWKTADLARREAPVESLGVIFDAPVLFESGLDAECDAVAFVEAPPDIRLERAVTNRGWSAKEFAQREAAQLDLEAKKGRCRFLIHNHGNLEDVRRQVESILAMMTGEDQADEA